MKLLHANKNPETPLVKTRRTICFVWSLWKEKHKKGMDELCFN